MINELTELAELEQKVTRTRERGERWVRGFWQTTLFFAFICFGRIFILPKVSADSSMSGNLPILVITVFGVVVVAALVLGDMIFFGKAYEWENQLEEALSRRAAELLAVRPEQVTLRKGSPGKGYILTFSLTRPAAVANRVTLETQIAVTQFRLQAERFEEALALVAEHRALLKIDSRF